MDEEPTHIKLRYRYSVLYVLYMYTHKYYCIVGILGGGGGKFS